MKSRIPNVGNKRPKYNNNNNNGSTTSHSPSPMATSSTTILNDIMLKDVTNNKYSYSKQIPQPFFYNSTIPTTLPHTKSKLTFGDQTSIELVKNRQRKILGDINRLNQAISDINKSIHDLQNNELINVHQETNILKDEIDVMVKDINSYDTQIQSLEDEIITMNNNEQMFITNETLRYKIECQDMFNKLDMEFIERRSHLEEELNHEINTFTPPTELTHEIDQLKHTTKEMEQEWGKVKTENKAKCLDRELQILKPELELFQSEKTTRLQDLKGTNGALNTKLSTLIGERDRYHEEMDNLRTNIELTRNEAQLMETEIDKLTTKDIPPLTLEHQTLSKQLSKSQSTLQGLQESYQRCQDQYSVEWNKLTAEKKRNQALTAAICKP